MEKNAQLSFELSCAKLEHLNTVDERAVSNVVRMVDASTIAFRREAVKRVAQAGIFTTHMSTALK